jgi:hypothetical protein
MIGAFAIADSGKKQIAVIQIPRLSMIVADGGLHSELRKTVRTVHVPFAYDVSHHDAIAGEQHEPRMVPNRVVELPYV